MTRSAPSQGDASALRRSLAFADFPTAVRGVDEIAVVAEEMGHHPDIDVRWRTLPRSTPARVTTSARSDAAHGIRRAGRRQGATIS